MAEISDGIATFGASHDMKEFADYPSYEKAFLLLHPQHREMVTQQDEFRELLKQEFEQPRSEQADSLSHLERQAGDIDWDELGV